MVKTTGIITAGRNLASSLFNSDPEFCKARNESSKNTNYSKVVAQSWSQGLPINAQQGKQKDAYFNRYNLNHVHN